MVWEREETAFILVSCVARSRNPICTMVITCRAPSGDDTPQSARHQG